MSFVPASETNDAHSLGARVDLSSYSSSNKYSCPSDGYIWVYNDTGKSGYVQIDNTNVSIGGVVGRFAVFVKKGTRIFPMGSATTFAFVPLQ